ncbi:MAG: P-loop NTPase [Phycisphaerales bacterium]
MIDAQAQRLRERMAAAAAAAPEAVAREGGARAATERAPTALRAIAVASGKGGVGKSTLALGIAMAAAERGVRTALVDADLGLANLDLLCGIQPARTAGDWLAGRATLAECFVRLAPRLWLLPGASGIAQLADLDAARRARVVEGLARTAQHVECMVIDLGAGLGAGTLELATASDQLVLAATPEPTALADAYGFAKACAARGRRDGVALAMTMCARTDDAAAAARRLQSTAARHLGVRVELLGAVPEDDAVRAAVRARTPLLAFAPESDAARAVRRIEGALAGSFAGAGGDACASASAAPSTTVTPASAGAPGAPQTPAALPSRARPRGLLGWLAARFGGPDGGAAQADHHGWGTGRARPAGAP